MQRYSVITDKNPREIALLRGSGCKWKRCRFCDYHIDFSANAAENFKLNQSVLAEITGIYGRLECINSGSFCDLDAQSMQEILNTCREKHIHSVHFECHWRDRAHISALRTHFAAAGITVKLKIGVESFDSIFREQVLVKGIDETDPAKIAADFDECCLLFGLAGQTEQSMRLDIETGLAHFERICLNLMTPNTAALQPDMAVCTLFKEQIAPDYFDNPRVDILTENTDFGVGG